MKVLPIGEARRRLSELVRKVAAGHFSIAIGRRGRCEAVLVPPSAATPPVQRRPLQGLMTLVGTSEALERERAWLRREVERSLERTGRLLAEGRRPHRRRAGR